MKRNKYNIPLHISNSSYINNSIDHYHKIRTSIYQRVLLILDEYSPNIITGIRLDKFIKM